MTTSDHERFQPEGPEPGPPFFKAWFLFALVSTVGGFLAGAVLGAIVGVILGAAGAPLGQVQLICGLLGFAIGLPISFLSFRWSVTKYLL